MTAVQLYHVFCVQESANLYNVIHCHGTAIGIKRLIPYNMFCLMQCNTLVPLDVRVI